MSTAKSLGDDCDHPSHEDIGRLLLESQALLFARLEGLLSNILIESQKKLLESQAKLVESQLAKLVDSQSKQVESQENTEVLRSSSGEDNQEDEEEEEQDEQEVEETEEEKRERKRVESYFEEEQEVEETEEEKRERKRVESYFGCQAPEEVKDDGVAIFIGDYPSLLLRQAVTEKNWDKAEAILERDPEVIDRGLTEISSTALHLAISNNVPLTFVEEIVNRMSPQVIACKSTELGVTALHNTVRWYGQTEAAKLIVAKNSMLTQIRNNEGMVPLELAFHHVTDGQKDIIKYLYSVTKDIDPSPFKGHDGARLLCSAIDANFYDMALSLVERFPDLVMEKSLVHNMCALELLVRRPFTFRSGTKLTWWQNCIYSTIQLDPTYNLDTDKEGDEENPNSGFTKPVKGLFRSSGKKFKQIMNSLVSVCLMPCLTQVLHIRDIQNQKLMHDQTTALLKQMVVKIYRATDSSRMIGFLKSNPNIMRAAIKHGIIEFMKEFLQKFIYLTDYRLPEQNILEMAIAERNELIVNLICKRLYNKTDLVSKIDDDGNTVLHYAAKLAPPTQLNLVAGAAIQMQRELQWFKGVESIMSVNDRFRRNKEGETAQSIFTEEHKSLVKEGEDWMKDTSGSCMIVSALIATVAFAAAFTVPGGNIGDNDNTKNGTPVFLGHTSFTVFLMADTLALTSSITSVLMFMAIYTSRYAEIDFLRSLPQKLILGLGTLFISMAAILVAFCASLFLIVGDAFPPIPIALFVCAPAALFAWLQLPLFYQMVRSTYWGGILRNHIYIDHTLEKKKEKRESIVIRVKKLMASLCQQ